MNRRDFLAVTGAAVATAATPAIGAAPVAQPPAGKARFRTGLVAYSFRQALMAKTIFDLDRVFTMFARHGFKGYMGLEYEAPEDPAVAVPRYLRRLKELAVKYSA